MAKQAVIYQGEEGSLKAVEDGSLSIYQRFAFDNMDNVVHLTREDAKALIPLLQEYITGEGVSFGPYSYRIQECWALLDVHGNPITVKETYMEAKVVDSENNRNGFDWRIKFGYQIINMDGLPEDQAPLSFYHANQLDLCKSHVDLLGQEETSSLDDGVPRF